jgi:hypothetical protein
VAEAAQTMLVWLNPLRYLFSELVATVFSTGLPDVIFSNKNSQFWEILEGLRLHNVGMYIFRSFGIFFGHWVNVTYDHCVHYMTIL